MFSIMILRTELGLPICWTSCEGLIPIEESSTLGLEAPACDGEAPPPDIVDRRLPGWKNSKREHITLYHIALIFRGSKFSRIAGFFFKFQ